ncbi:unnamed protein product [Adineta ricciae]|uniref:Uncharacterized protein n=1 Tax=Adineta ricciae TaxID=249248 RepID=A0A815TJT2_ADIRI|nr:unnamed protein product [Adineta ricciae]CAF1503008.1 unnamed protein product [Adineta ricciae]
MWHSCHSNSGLLCRNCNSSTLSHSRDPDDWEDLKFIEMHKSQYKDVLNAMNPNGTHNESLCQKCREMGRSCRATENDELETLINRPFSEDDSEDDMIFTTNNRRPPNISREDEYKPLIRNYHVCASRPQVEYANTTVGIHPQNIQQREQSQRSKIFIRRLLCIVLLAILLMTLFSLLFNIPKSVLSTTTTTTTSTTTTTTTITTTTTARTTTTPCFSSKTMVTLESGIQVPLHNLQVGEQVRIDSHKSSAVLAIFRHYRSSILFMEIYFNENRSQPLRLTPTHSVLVRGSHDESEQYRFARDISAGDFVYSTLLHQMVKVIKIRESTNVDDYAYAPLTFEGRIVTNNIIASCYATYPHWLMHIITTPLRWWYWLLIELEQAYLHALSTSFCVQCVDWYLQFFLVATTFIA